MRDNHSVRICDDYRRYRLRFATGCGRITTQQSECVKMLRPRLHWETDATAFFPVKKFDILIIIDSIGCRLESTCVLGSPIVAPDSFRSLGQSLPYTVSVYQTLLRFLTEEASRNRPHQGIAEDGLAIDSSYPTLRTLFSLRSTLLLTEYKQWVQILI